MRLSIDPKPIGAFIEYTIKPLIDDSRELLEKLELHGVRLKDYIGYAVTLFLIDKIFTLITHITVAWMVCSTAYSILSYSQITSQ